MLPNATRSRSPRSPFLDNLRGDDQIGIGEAATGQRLPHQLERLALTFYWKRSIVT
jgi:hypothetical protein